MIILTVISGIYLGAAIMEVIRATTGEKRKMPFLLSLVILLIPALSPLLMDVEALHEFFILRLILLILSIFSKFIAFSIIFRRIKLNILYICLMSLITSQMYATLLSRFLPAGHVLDIAAMLTEGTVLLIILFIIRKRKLELTLQQELKAIAKYQYVMVIILAYIINIFVWASLSEEHHRIAEFLLMPTLVGFTIVLISVISTTAAASKQKMVSELLADQIEKQTEYYDNIKQIYSEFRSFRHDFKNHLLCIRSLLAENETEKATDYISDIEGVLEREKQDFDTGNIIVDSLLSDKKAKALRSGTRIEFTGFVPTMGLSNVDACIIFSNAIDNAIEACAKDQSGQDKVISIKSDFKKGYYFLTISNPVFESVNFKGKNQLVTSKENKTLHGLGVPNIIRAVHKYEGTVDISAEDNRFTLEIVMHLKKEQ